MPHADALKDALDPKRLDKEEHVIHAITQQCEILGARELHDELGESTFMRNYPQDKQEPRGATTFGRATTGWWRTPSRTRKTPPASGPASDDDLNPALTS